MAGPDTTGTPVPARFPTGPPFRTPSPPQPPIVTTQLPDGPRQALGEASMPGVQPAARGSTTPSMLTWRSSRRDSRSDSAAGKATSGGTPVASCRPELHGGGFNSFLPLEVPVPATAGLDISVLTVAVTRAEPSCSATSAGVGGGGTRPEVTGFPVRAGAGGLSVDVRLGDVSP